MDRGAPTPRAGAPRQPVSAHTTILPHIPTLIHTNRVAHTYGTLGNHKTLMLLNSGASRSVVLKSCKHIEPLQSTKLVNADGRDITPYGSATMTVGLGQFSTSHKFVAVNHLSTSVILGCDFLFNHGYVLYRFWPLYLLSNRRSDKVLQLQPEQTLPCNIITLDDGCPQAIPVAYKHTSSPTGLFQCNGMESDEVGL